MQWSPQQDAALREFRRWWNDKCPGNVFHIFGFAGTGKTTLALELTQGIDGTVRFAAFTGKAASVMRKKGCAGASTIHSLIYSSKQNSRLRLVELERKLVTETSDEERDRLRQEIAEERRNLGQPSFSLNKSSELRNAALLVVDEVSMVDGRIGEDLLSFNKPILVLGDPAQLPPVKGAGFFMTERPEVMLTEVHRTALDNPVLHMATRVRENQSLDFGNYGESVVVARQSLREGASLDYDQVIVGKNATRHFANNSIRRQLGFHEPMPMVNDRVICLKNQHDKGLLNGVLFNVVESEDTGYELLLTVQPVEGGALQDVEAYRQPFEGQDVPRWNNEGFEEFGYGYAITAHKSQGSEWPSVYIIDESSSFRADAKRWLYTAITRASEKVMVVR